jgi:hypothetical protein
MERKSDVTTYKPGTPGSKGRPKHSTKMVSGSGKMSKAQMDSNVTAPYGTGKAPEPGKLGGLGRHDGDTKS